MQIEERQVGNVTIFNLVGRATPQDWARLKDTREAATHIGRAKLLLNLSEVPYVNSDGLGEIVRGHAAVGRAGGILKLCCRPTSKFRKVLADTHVDTAIEVFSTEAEALQSFSL